MKKSGVENNLASSTLECAKSARISKNRKSPTVLKRTKAPLKRRSAKKAHVKNTNNTDR